MTKFVLDDAVFANVDEERAGRLDDLLSNTVQLLHRLEVDPSGAQFVRWLSSRDNVTKGRWRTMLATGPDRMLRARFQIVVRELSKSDWSCDPPQLTLADAVRLSRIAAELVVENDRNDREFVEVFARQDQLEKLNEAVLAGALTITSRGGITEMSVLARNRIRDPFLAFRTYFLCDSDSLAPGMLSPDAARLARTWPSRSHVLNRRAAENYLPREALERWAGRRTHIRGKVDAFFDKYFNADPARRHHFNMKKGFVKDNNHKHKDQCGTLYDAIPSTEHQLLSEGFGPTVRDAFSPRPNQDELVRDGSLGEMSRVLSEILSLVG